MKIYYTYFLFLFFILISCEEKQYSIEDNLIRIKLSGSDSVTANTLGLEVINSNIIRVIASPEETLNTNKSMILDDNFERLSISEFTVDDENDQIVLKTSTIKVVVEKATGAVSFYDKNNDNILLEEVKNNGKKFVPVKLDAEQAYQVQQRFDSPANEAFFGLGQHQNGQMNYKGDDVDLTQYNSVIAVPFLVSNLNYGILWNNTSITKFGDPRDYQSLSGLRLYDINGKEGGLSATYKLKNDSTQKLERTEKEINYKYLEDMKELPEFPLFDATVTYEGFIESELSGLHKFLLTSAGYTKVWIDGKLLSENWREAWNPNNCKFKTELQKGKKHSIKVWWEPDGTESYLALEWLSPLNADEQNSLTLSSEVADQIDYYFIHGQDMDEIISGYRFLTGKAPIMPKWAMGLWQSRERYKSQKELLDVVAEYRKREIPLDNIVLDWQYWSDDQWGSHEFNPERFPDPQGMIDQVHDANANIMISVWPKFYVGTRHYDEMNNKGWLYTKNVENHQKDWIGYVSTFYDAFNPEARQLFWLQMKEELYEKNIDAWWMDATEPDILSNSSITHRKELMKPNHLGDPARYFNAYPLANAKGIYEGQRKEDPNKRVFILTRSAYAGMQRYAAASWSGDISARWDELQKQIPAGLNFSLSGLPYWTTDIGGFFVEDKFENPQGEDLEEWRELMTRWFQYSTFCPLLRLHGQYPYREIYNVAPEQHAAYQSMVKFNQLRYRLMPYIYSTAASTYHDDYTIMRALVMDFPEDEKVLNIGDQYMFGDALMVAPVYEYKAREREVYLPEGTGWYHFFSGKFYEGGQTITIPVPMDEMPLFVKEGSILVSGPEIQFATEKVEAPFTVYIFTGEDGLANLYEDESINYNYESGKYTNIPFQYNDSEQELIVGERQGEFQGMSQERTFNINIINKNNTKGVQFDEEPYKQINYNGKSMTVNL